MQMVYFNFFFNLGRPPPNNVVGASKSVISIFLINKEDFTLPLLLDYWHTWYVCMKHICFSFSINFCDYCLASLNWMNLLTADKCQSIVQTVGAAYKLCQRNCNLFLREDKIKHM